LGFGTYQLSIDQAEFCIKEALEAGFRHIDSAEGYNNEEGTGKGIKAAGVSRDNIFVTTKLFPGYKQWGAPEKTYEQTIESLKNQLKQLQLDYVDLYLCPQTEDFMKYLVVLIIVLLSSTLLFSEQLPKMISKGASEL
jgi:2,5-diketo-D-gluconate reductase A